MKDKIEDNLKEESEDGLYFDTLGGGQDRPDDLGDPLSCETDLKMTKSESSSSPLGNLLLIKIEEGCQKRRTQCSLCCLELIEKEDLKIHMIKEHMSYGADRLRCSPEKVKTN